MEEAPPASWGSLADAVDDYMHTVKRFEGNISATPTWWSMDANAALQRLRSGTYTGANKSLIYKEAIASEGTALLAIIGNIYIKPQMVARGLSPTGWLYGDIVNPFSLILMRQPSPAKAFLMRANWMNLMETNPPTHFKRWTNPILRFCGSSGTFSFPATPVATLAVADLQGQALYYLDPLLGRDCSTSGCCLAGGSLSTLSDTIWILASRGVLASTMMMPSICSKGC